QGYVCLWRRLLGNPVWTQLSPVTLKVMLGCLLQANWKERTWYDGKQQVTIPRGSFITSYSKMAEVCKVTLKQVRLSLLHLQNLQITASSRAGMWTMVTVLNYETYQYEETTEGKDEGRVRAGLGQGQVSKGAGLGQQLIKRRNITREEEEKTPREDAASGAPAEGSLFDLQADEQPAPPKPKRLTSTIMTAEQRDWFAEYLSTHPKNTIQLKSATKLFYEKVKTQDCFDFIIAALRREAAGETQFMEGPCNWLASHLALYASGVSAATPIRMAPAVKLSKTDEAMELARRNFERRGSPFA
ncbi:MAG: hypothetical protein ABFD89_21360, partial [Bryobacteraceae bacterium]